MRRGASPRRRRARGSAPSRAARSGRSPWSSSITRNGPSATTSSWICTTSAMCRATHTVSIQPCANGRSRRYVDATIPPLAKDNMRPVQLSCSGYEIENVFQEVGFQRPACLGRMGSSVAHRASHSARRAARAEEAARFPADRWTERLHVHPSPRPLRRLKRERRRCSRPPSTLGREPRPSSRPRWSLPPEPPQRS